MSSANRLLIFLFLGIFSSSLYTVDVSSFDIKGIKLRMSKSEVLKNISCQNHKIKKSIIDTINGKKLIVETISCENGIEDIHIYLDKNGRVYNIDRVLSFKVEPSLKKIKNKAINHYGKPNNRILGSSDSRVWQMCWGQCGRPGNYGYYPQYARNSQYLTIGAFRYSDNNIKIFFTMDDTKLSRLNKSWIKEQELLYEKQQKEKASNIDF